MRNWILPGLAALALAGCGSGNEGTIKTEDGDVDYSISGDGEEASVRMEGPDGVATLDMGENVKPDLPDGLSVYPGAKVTNVSNISNDGTEQQTKGSFVSMDTTDSPEKVTAWYREQAAKAGFKIEAQLKTGELHVVSGKRSDGWEINVTASDSDGGASVQLIAGKGLMD